MNCNLTDVSNEKGPVSLIDDDIFTKTCCGASLPTFLYHQCISSPATIPFETNSDHIKDSKTMTLILPIQKVL